MKLKFTRRAAGELEDILEFLDSHSPQGGRKVKIRIQDMISLLLRHPQAGPLTSKSKLRRVVVYPYPFLIFYRASETEIIIHAVRHSARGAAPLR